MVAGYVRQVVVSTGLTVHKKIHQKDHFWFER